MQGKGSGHPVSLPMPRIWLDSLKANGIHINYFGSKFYLYKFSLYCFFKGIIKVLLLLFQYKSHPLNNKKSAVFIDLTLANVPHSKERKSYDLISWYKRSNIKDPAVKDIYAQVNGANFDFILPNIIVCSRIFSSHKNWGDYLKYFLKVFKAITIAFFGMLIGKWWYGLLFDESAYFQYISIFNNNDLPQEYLFHQGSAGFKPLWTYEAEKKGSRISLYWYSTNSGPYDVGNHKIESDIGLKIMQWNHMIVWNEEQKKHWIKYCPKTHYKITGPIQFLDSDKKIGNYQSKKLLGVFDVTPTRPILYTSLGYAIPPYYSTELSFKFFSDIASLDTGNNTITLWKKKRIVGYDFINKGFVKKLNEQLTKKNIVPINPDIAVEKIIEKCNVVISMPYTSVAIIAKKYQIPSIFYDASGNINTSERHGIPVLKNKDELNKWWSSLNIN
tara:strand:+ start:2742 stop:4073 length:1332 start_codon:yes stop_codon:yes gene_type:complete